MSRRPVAEVESHVDDRSCLNPESKDATVRAVRRPCATGDPDYHPGQANTCNELENETKFTGVPKIWHVHSSSEMAKLQRNDSDIGPILKLCLQSKEQPSFDMIRNRRVNTKHYWSNGHVLLFVKVSFIVLLSIKGDNLRVCSCWSQCRCVMN